MAGRKFENGIDLLGNKAVNLADGSANTDAATVGQMKSFVNGLDFKNSVRAASTTNITITAPGASIDGVAMANGDRFLARNQTTGSQNNIYVWNGAAVAATIAPDAINGELSSRATVIVEEGTQGGNQYTLATANPIVVGTTSLTWNASGGGTVYTNGAGLLLSSGQFSVDFSVVPKKYAANFGDGTTTSYTITHNLGTLDFICETYIVAGGEKVEFDIFHATTNTATVVANAAPASNSARFAAIG